MQIVRKIILFVCLFCPVTIYAQWSFTGTVNGEGGGMGNMCVLDKKYAESQVSSYSGKQFATQSECEKARQYVMNSVSAGCKDYIIVSCSPCTGAGGVTGSVSGSNFGDFDWFGTKPFASTNDYLDNLTLKENFDRYMEALSSIMDEYNTRDWGLPTGDLEYDAERVKQYSDLMNDRDFIVKKGVAPKGRGIVMNRTNNSIYSFTPRLFEKPELPVLEDSIINEYIPEKRVEWLNRIENMSQESLMTLEKTYLKIYDMASISQYAYKNDEKDLSAKPETWDEISEESDKDLYDIIKGANDNLFGFKCALMKNKDGQYVLSFAGTDSFFNIDVVEDVAGALFKYTPQAIKALDVVNKLLDKLSDMGINKENLILTGHSLGGRLAAEAAIKKDLLVYTFNAAGTTGMTKTEALLKNDNINVLNISSSNDPLTWFQNIISPIVNTATNMSLVNTGIREDLPINDIRVSGDSLTIKEADGGHSIESLRLAIKQRHNDIIKKIDKKK